MDKLLTCEWRKLAFINYTIPPELVEGLLPAHTKLDLFNGSCFVSLVGFLFKNIQVGGIKVPFYSDFEEVNFRFYVKRFDGTQWRKGTVFISEIADKPAMGLLANTLLREHYQVLPTGREIHETENQLEVKYSWKHQDQEQFIRVKSDRLATPYPTGTESDFILDRLYGYGRIDEKTSREYAISHSKWQVYQVQEYTVKVDFAKQFGAAFSILSSATPHSVMLTEGSKVEFRTISKIRT